MLYRLDIAYDGTGFHGWARQPGRRTVEGVLAEAVATLYRAPGAHAVAGRTDAGVHALANVVSLEASGGPPPARAVRAFNALLPSDLAVTRVEQAPAGFNARFSALSRTYRYRIWRGAARSPFEASRSLWRPGPIELARLEACARALPGEHDFRAFTPKDTQHAVFVRRVIEARWQQRGEALEFEITADSFLRHMVRTLVGTMLSWEPEAFARLLEGAPRSSAGATAPACGLYLLEVAYPGRQGAAAQPGSSERALTVRPADERG
jgi:tRNA pseudouridine38-40 synthase